MLPSITYQRRGRAAAIAALSLIGVGLTACDRRPEPAPTTAPQASTPPQALPQPLPQPAIDRAELLAAISAARAASAAGQPETSASLTGRRFVLRQAFACGPWAEKPSTLGGPMVAGVAHGAWGKDRKTLEVSLTPDDWLNAPAFSGQTAWEAVEGYWLTRPWLPTADCPVRAPPADGDLAPSAIPPSVNLATPLVSGLAAVFATDSSRVSRRDGKPFILTVRGDAPLAAPADGYRLVIEGRLSAFADGQVIRCKISDPDQAPVCIAAAEVDRVAFEDAEGKVLKEWRQG